jgi:YidC/Oxa1 family membrane protein insertase
MQDESQRNLLYFVMIAAAIMVVYQVFVLGPQENARRAAQAQAQAVAAAQHPAAAQAPAAFLPVSQAAQASPRVKIDTPSLSGTLALRGARIDDLSLKHYRTDVKPGAPLVDLLRPAGAEHAWFADVDWSGAPGAPGADTLWTAAPGATLTPNTPLVLTYDSGQGLKFTRTISVDADYMFTIADAVTNAGPAPVSLTSYGSVQQRGLPSDLANSSIVHEGAIAVLNREKLEHKYKDWKKDGAYATDAVGGWLGITQKYWLTALIPDQSTPIKAQFRVTPAPGDIDIYQAGFVGPAETVAPGATLARTTKVFAGAKLAPQLAAYAKTQGIYKFDLAIDWGHLWFITQPLFDVLEWINGNIGNFGLSILALTVLIKLVFFPLQNKSFESITKMKKIQPQVEELKGKFEKDPAKLQQETMALYQREKINPLMGCLPMLVQIPVLYALTKVLTVTIEMRQAPFFGWIHDLASRDPTTIWNLFGLVPYDPSHLVLVGGLLNSQLHIGVWPLLYGFSMWLSQAMSPPSPDPTQRMIFQFMPVIFTFTMSQFTVGLVIYWLWSNLLSILQQYVIMRRFKVDNPIDDFIGRFIKPKPAVG